MDNAFQYIINNNGICAESDYPYTARDGACRSCSPVAIINSFKDVDNSVSALESALIFVGPVSIAIEADQRSFQFYSGGVLTASCG